MQVVKLTYFKSSGKYYSSGELEVDTELGLLRIWTKVKELNKTKLPGLAGTWNGPILVECPGHEHDHPVLLNLGYYS